MGNNDSGNNYDVNKVNGGNRSTVAVQRRRLAWWRQQQLGKNVELVVA